MNIKNITNYQKPLVIILIIFSIFISSCSNDGFITQSSDTNSLNKPNDITSAPISLFSPLFAAVAIGLIDGQTASECLLLAALFAPYLFSDDEEHSSSKYASIFKDRDLIIEKSYDFRDNFLAKSAKGKDYIQIYKDISKYGFENNLIGRHYKEHISLIQLCVGKSQIMKSEYGSDKTIFDQNAYAEIKNILNIYRKSNNASKIRNQLNSLESDVDNYFQKSKAEISADFRF